MLQNMVLTKKTYRTQLFEKTGRKGYIYKEKLRHIRFEDTT